jgi:hypothetical protein
VKVLFDENMPHKLRRSFVRHEAVTVGFMDSNGLKNGELIKAAEEAGFEILVTGDKSLTYQQNLADRRIAIVTLSAHNWPIIKHHLAVIVAAVDSALPGSFVTVDCGELPK